MKLTGNNKGVKIGSFAAPPKGVQARAGMLAAVTNALSQPTDPDFNPEATFESSQGDIGDVLSNEARKPKRQSFAAFRSLLAQAKAEAPQQQQQQQATQEKTQQQQGKGAEQAQARQQLENPNERSVQRASADAAQAGGQPLKNEKDEKKSTSRRGSSSTSSAKSSFTAASFAPASNAGFEAELPEGQLPQQGQAEEAPEGETQKATRGKAQGLNSKGQAPAGQSQQQAPTTFKGAAFIKPGEGAEQVQRQNPAHATDQKSQLTSAEAAKTSGATAFTESAKKATKGTSSSTDRNSNAAFDEAEGEEEGFVDTRNFLQMRNFYRSFSEVERRISIGNRGFNAGYSPWGEAARQVALSF